MSSTKLKVAVLYDVWEETEPPPEPPPEKPARGKRRKKKREKADREEIFEALGKLGHEPFYQVLDGAEKTLVALAKCDADLVFNLTESYAGDDTKDMNIAAYLELLDCQYTGAGPLQSGVNQRLRRSHELRHQVFTRAGTVLRKVSGHLSQERENPGADPVP